MDYEPNATCGLEKLGKRRRRRRHPRKELLRIVMMSLILSSCVAVTPSRVAFCRAWKTAGVSRRPRSSLSILGSSSSSTTAGSSNATSASTSTLSSSATKADDIEKRKDKNAHNQSARKKRLKFIGLAKAIDHGQPGLTTYQLATTNSGNYVAASGLPDRRRPFTVLGIESSCDDTGAAIVRSDGTILGEALASQHDIHESWGGVVPGLARDEHVKNIDRVVEQALQRAGLNSVEQVDAIGVTVGPGLEICLRVGANKARELAVTYQKPFVGVHHLEAHILMARLPVHNNKGNSDDDDDKGVVIPATKETHEGVRAMEFPFLALLVSGGHCQILHCLGIGKYKILGGTLDDSLGEAYDKSARLLGLPVGGGGGPAMEALAKDGDPLAIPLTVPLQRRQDCDFSFAGLKTNVRRAAERLCQERGVETVEALPYKDKANLAASFQNIAIKHIEHRLERAMKCVEQPTTTSPSIRNLALVGGVAANQELRSRLKALCEKVSQSSLDDDEQESVTWRMFVPPPRLCTDQGSMSAWAAIEKLMIGSSDDPTNQEVFARYPFSVEQDDER